MGGQIARPTPKKGKTEMEYVLKYPFTFDGKKIDKISIRRPKGRDAVAMAKAADDPNSNPFMGHALLTGLDENVFDEMDLEDVNAIGNIVQDFLPKATPAT